MHGHRFSGGSPIHTAGGDQHFADGPLSALIVRLRTQADGNGVTVRTLLGSRSVRWEEIDGLRFRRGSWARAQLKNGRELRLPAVTFATLPQLTQASAGRVPNPYAD
jgi:hypothetical protein